MPFFKRVSASLPALMSALAVVLFGGCSRSAPETAAAVAPSSEVMRHANHTEALSLAVLGDSDSESYAGIAERGGPYHERTWQWTEVLARLRGDQIDAGEWGTWGTPGRIAALQRKLGFDVKGRAPRKRDHRFNFAISGATCDELMGGVSRQAPQLVSLMDQDPLRWRRGVVVVRIGVNTFGKAEGLERLARDPAAPQVVAQMDFCAQQVRAAVALIHAHHPQTRIVLVGIFDNTHWVRYVERWRSAGEIKNIQRGLDRFDQALRDFAARDARLAFFDDRAWFAGHWGGRAPDGSPAYRTATVVPGWEVSNTVGDEPHHAVIVDGHAGLAWNLLWARSLVELLNQRFALGLRPLSDAELAEVLSPPSQAKARP